jgi:exopolyphosphatase
LDIDEEIRQRIDRAIHSLSTMKTMLGDLHDDQVAYSIYNDWNVHSEDSVLRTSVETKWKDFRAWANEVDIFATIDFLRDSLHTDESLSSEGKEEGKEKEEKAGDLESFLIDHRYNPTNHVVLGNDAGDADSIVSAITLAYIESMNSTGHDCSTPIVSISKDTFIQERPETNLLFQLAGIKDNVAEKLLFIEDLQEILEKNAKGGLCPGPSVSLVDHNTLNDSLLRFQDDLIVTEILDHHEDEHKYEETCFGDRRIIAFDDGHVLVASTTTLVAERLRLQKFPHPYPASIGTLLLGVILLDSINLDESIGKVTERDRVAVDDLLANTDWNAAVQSSHIRMDETGTITVDSNALFDTLQLAKYDPKYWDELPALRALASDYKHFGDDEARNESEFGISSILMSGEDFMKKEDFEKATLEFMHTSQIFLLGIIFVFYDELGVLLKQIAFISSDVNFPLCEFVDSFLVSDEYKNVDLQLIEVPHLTRTDQSELLQIRLFDQENLTPSRKQIGPMLEDYFDTRIL